MQLRLLSGLTPYDEALVSQHAAVAAVLKGEPEQFILCQHPSIYTTGSSASSTDILTNPHHLPVIPTGRGGQVTWHGPGQRVAYVIKDLRQTKDLRAHIQTLQYWLIHILKDLGVRAHLNEHVGVWVNTPHGEKKVAAIGVRVRQWVAFHGVALNVDCDLAPYDHIIPCGIRGKGVTSLHAIGLTCTMEQVDALLIATAPQYGLSV